MHVVPHPYVHAGTRATREPCAQVRRIASSACSASSTAAKRAEVVLEAFAKRAGRDPSLTLLVVGEPAPNIDVDAMRRDGVVFTGYVPDEDFSAYFAAADRL